MQIINKRNFLLFFITFIIVFNTACVKVKTNIDIDRNGNAKVTDTLLLPNTFFGSSEYNLSKDTADEWNRNNKHLKNYNTEVIYEDEYAGYKTFYQIDDISKNEFPKTEQSSFYLNDNKNIKIAKVDKNFLNTEYNINIFIKYPDDFPEGFLTDHKFSITIPVKAIDHNANTVDEKSHTYTWSFPKEIKLKFKVINIGNLSIILLSIFFTLLLIFIFILFFVKHKESLKKQYSRECPVCGEKIDINESQCKYCGENLNNEIKNE